MISNIYVHVVLVPWNEDFLLYISASQCYNNNCVMNYCSQHLTILEHYTSDVNLISVISDNKVDVTIDGCCYPTIRYL